MSNQNVISMIDNIISVIDEPESKEDIDLIDKGIDIGKLQSIGKWIDSYVVENRLSGASVAILRDNKLIYETFNGYSNAKLKKPLTKDTIFRLYSMSKPITSTGLMILYDDGKFDLNDPISKYIPTFAECPGIYDYESNKDIDPCLSNIQNGKLKFIKPKSQILIKHLLTFTAGLAYMFDKDGKLEPVDAIYNDCCDFHTNIELSLSQLIDDKMAKLPLCHEPGTRWNYSFCVDVIGRLIEVLSGKPLPQFLYERIFKPLGMNHTAFYIEDKYNPLNIDDLMVLYGPDLTDKENNFPIKISQYEKEDGFQLNEKTKGAPMGGGTKGALLSTLNDYTKFCQMLLNGGEKILSTKTLKLMTSNQLPDNKTYKEMGHPRSFLHSRLKQGMGFGYGFGVCVNDKVTRLTKGSYQWTGAGDTIFWIDPIEKLIVVFMTQFIGNLKEKTGIDLRTELEELVYSAFIQRYDNDK